MLKLNRPNLHFFPLLCLVGMLALTGLAQISRGQQVNELGDMNTSLRSFLQTYAGSSDKSLRYAAAIVDSGDPSKEEVLVYITGRSACGTAGCSLLILKLQDESFQIIGHEAAVKLPIRALHTETNGRTDIGVWSQWGIGDSGHEVSIPFDGNNYVKSSNRFPATRVPANTPGDILIPLDDEGIPLFGNN